MSINIVLSKNFSRFVLIRNILVFACCSMYSFLNKQIQRAIFANKFYFIKLLGKVRLHWFCNWKYWFGPTTWGIRNGTISNHQMLFELLSRIFIFRMHSLVRWQLFTFASHVMNLVKNSFLFIYAFITICHSLHSGNSRNFMLEELFWRLNELDFLWLKLFHVKSVIQLKVFIKIIYDIWIIVQM